MDVFEIIPHGSKKAVPGRIVNIPASIAASTG
jgi:hypothetical protein